MIGIAADDVTGANDIGIMYAKAGLVTDVYSYNGLEPLVMASHPDVLVLDTDSRFLPGKTAYELVYQAVKELEQAGCTRFYNKTCSVFRGNIGAEFDAMLDALGEDFAVVVLGFPKNGRTTIDGIHYVRGRKLEDSEFRNDPMHPMTQSNLAEILQAQTRRKVAVLSYETIRKGPVALREEIGRMRSQCSYLILDVENQQSLEVIAEAVEDERVLAGSSALAEELAKRLAVSGRQEGEQTFEPAPMRKETGILCTAGSLMPQTAEQIAFLQKEGNPSYKLDTRKLFDRLHREELIAWLTEAIVSDLLTGRDVLLYSANEPQEVALTKAEGAGRGLSSADVSRLVSTSLAEVTAQVLARTGQTRLLVAGGDTSASLCARLGIRGMRVWKEIEPGLPSCLSLTGGSPLLLVLKSGSFGKPDFFKQAYAHLKSN
ncbi:four-carbon acid sugar kinase family protein [Paenibacillus aurantius]|uniref:Four-carbon acid sugar kinase family protein n=1 Tax=Paenibacillus aurantius TaxID=2918900 RepID=A0AA96L9N2_9BACL|nr:four-carbon acid sugar kinase family protein [Paenibacillus aurantius]WNQ09098.1 four-carbon acid sugar kinase family protein [Paenibacillus aurantius]